MLPEPLLEAVLAKLGFSARPEPSWAGLAAVYGAWCRRVPFDNVRKLAHVRRGDPGRLPGDEPAEFFDSWLRFGAGGTCWSVNGALCALLAGLGFDARRVIGTMLVTPDLPPNHGSVSVDLDGRRYVVDASMLHGEPLALEETDSAAASGRCWTVTAAKREGRWAIRWRPLQIPEGIDCRLERFDVSVGEFRDLHERARVRSPFNHELRLRLNRGESVIGAALGRRIEFDAAGRLIERPMNARERLRFLVEEIGIGEELAAAVPPDRPTPDRPSTP